MSDDKKDLIPSDEKSKKSNNIITPVQKSVSFFNSGTIEQNQYINVYDEKSFNLKEYRNYLSVLDKEPLFGGERVSLNDVFIDLDYSLTIHDSNLDLPLINEEAERETSILTKLLSYAEYSKDIPKFPVLMFASAGMGKSSVLKRVASEVARNKEKYQRDIIFAPLKNVFSYSKTDICDGLSNYLQHFGNLNLSKLVNNAVIILDGFDELNLAMEDPHKIGERYEQIKNLISNYGVCVILSSRPLLFHSNKHNIPDGTEIISPLSLTKEQIVNWIEKWNSLKQTTLKSYEDILKRNLRDIVSTPLLLYLTGSIFDEYLRVEKGYLSSEIYDKFISSIEKGKLDKEHNSVHGLENLSGTPRDWLRALALTMTQNFDEHTETVNLDVIKKNILSNIPEHIHIDQQINIDLPKISHQLIVAHFIEETVDAGNNNQSKLEFTHKSFREYLMAEEIFECLKSSLRNNDFDKQRWLKYGSVIPDLMVLSFLEDMINLMSLEDRQKLSDIIGEYNHWTYMNYMVDEKIITKAYVIAFNLCCLIYCINSMIYDAIKKDCDKETTEKYLKKLFPEKETLQILSRMAAAYHQTEIVVAVSLFTSHSEMLPKSLSQTILPELCIKDNILSNNFYECTMNSCSFNRLIIENSVFDFCDMWGSLFLDCKIRDTKYKRCEMSDVNFSRVNSNDCQYSYVSFDGASIHNSEFDNCRFEYCKLNFDPGSSIKFNACTFICCEIELPEKNYFFSNCVFEAELINGNIDYKNNDNFLDCVFGNPI